MTLSDMRRIADLCGVKIHTYSMTPGTIHVTLYPALQAKLQLFIECMDGAMPLSLRTVVTCHDVSCTCETCNPPAVLTLDELRLREAQAAAAPPFAVGARVAAQIQTMAEDYAAKTIARDYPNELAPEAPPTRAAAFASAAARANGINAALVAGVSPIEATPLHVVDSRSYLCSRCARPVWLGDECTCAARASEVTEHINGAGTIAAAGTELTIAKALGLQGDESARRLVVRDLTLADACGTLTTQNTELLAENARLRRELERGKPKPKTADRTTAWQPTLATGLIPRRGR